MQKLIVKIEPQKNNSYLVTFQGDFDGYAKENLTDIQNLLKEKKSIKLIFDFSGLNFLNSYAIGHLVAWRNEVSEGGGDILIAGANKNVQEIFSILGINAVFQLFDSREQALKSIKA